MCNVRKMKRRGIKSGNYIEYNLCTAVCFIYNAKLCTDLFTKKKIERRKRKKTGQKCSKTGKENNKQ